MKGTAATASQNQARPPKFKYGRFKRVSPLRACSSISDTRKRRHGQENGKISPCPQPPRYSIPIYPLFISAQNAQMGCTVAPLLCCSICSARAFLYVCKMCGYLDAPPVCAARLFNFFYTARICPHPIPHMKTPPFRPLPPRQTQEKAVTVKLTA